jgi:hypothetical protein
MIRPFQFQAAPFDFDRLYGNEKYSLNYMLLKMANFPAKIDTSVDRAFEIYSDRVSHPWSQALTLIKTKYTGDAYIAGATDESFLAFAGKLFALVENESKFIARYKEIYKSLARDNVSNPWQQAADEIESLPITGAICVRFTDGGGFPSLFLSGVIQKSNQLTYNGDAAPFVKQSRMERTPRDLRYDF